MNPRGPFRAATVLLFAGMALYVVMGFDQHNISNDEPVQQRYGELLLDWYASGFTDTRAFSYLNLHHYGGLFDMLAAGLAPHVPLDLWDLRHLLTGLAGLSGLAATAWLARMLGGARAGFLAAGLLALCGSWSGTLFTHTKDIPFAAATIWALACSTRVLLTLPRPSWGVLAGTGIAMGAALGLRYGGVLLPAYLAACLLLALARGGLPWAAVPRLWPVPALTALLMAVFWPWSVTGWDHFLLTARSFSHYEFDLLTLMDGTYVPAREVPTSYLFHYLARSLPELFLLALALAAVLGPWRLLGEPGATGRLLRFGPLLLSLAVPLAVVVLTRPALYNGTRHFTFLLPSLAVVAALGLEHAGRLLVGRRRLLAVGAATLAVLAVDAAAQLWRLHPYQYVAWNRLGGGVAGAWGRWEQDYWNDAMRPAAAALQALVAAEQQSGPAPREPWRVAVCAEPIQALHHLDGRFVATRDWPDADFFIASTSTRCDRALQGEVVVSIEREGVPLGVVKDRRRLAPSERGVR